MSNIQSGHRDPYSDKRTYGHALLIAGSYCMEGAAVLAARACMRAGVGLLTVHTPSRCVEVMQVACPEALVEADPYPDCFTTVPANLSRYQAIAIGPGISTQPLCYGALRNTITALKALPSPPPLLLDADALNIIAAHKADLLPLLPHGTAITPHAREYDRLFGPFANDEERRQQQSLLASRHSLNILLKGHRTTVCSPDGQHYTNTTGNAGMATAGSGDVLTGIVLALMAQGITPYRALCTGACIHGKSGDIAVEKQSESSLIASDIVENLKYVEW